MDVGYEERNEFEDEEHIFIPVMAWWLRVDNRNNQLKDKKCAMNRDEWSVLLLWGLSIGGFVTFCILPERSIAEGVIEM